LSHGDGGQNSQHAYDNDEFDEGESGMDRVMRVVMKRTHVRVRQKRVKYGEILQDVEENAREIDALRIPCSVRP